MRRLEVEMPDGSVFGIPFEILERSYKQYWPDADLDDDDVINNARNYLDWTDVYDDAVMVKPPKPIDYEDGWVNGEISIKEVQS